MAVKTRTPRTSSGANKERKARRVAEQEARHDANVAALSDVPNGSAFLSRTDHKGSTHHVRPSVALRSAKRAQRFAAAKSKD